MREEAVRRAQYEEYRAFLWDLACGFRRLGRMTAAETVRSRYQAFTDYAVVSE